MSLIHWWPLDGNLYDLAGGNHLKYINNNSKLVINNAGKLGKCYERTAIGTADLLRSTEPMKVFKEESICAWIYVSQHAALSTANGVITNHDHNSNSGLGIGVYSTDGTNYYVSINAGNKSGRIHSSYWGGTNIKGAWHHVCLISDGSKIRMYVDGKEDRTAVSYSVYSKADYLDIFNWSTGYYNQTNYRPACKVCDVRIYDHALSEAEIKEISKGLLVHYSFNDLLSEPTINLVTGVASGGRTTVNSTNLTVTTTGENKDTYFYLKFSEALVEGETYTIQCIGENIDEDKEFTFGVGAQASENPRFIIKNGLNKLTFVATSACAKTQVLFDDVSRSGWEKNATFSKFQVEKKGYFSPYVKTSRNSMIIDESGYNHPITLVNNCYFTSDTEKGSLALRTAGASDTASFATCSYLKSDIGVSLTPTAFTISTFAKVNTWGKQTSGMISLSTASSDPTDYQGSTLAQYDGKFQLNASGVTTGYSLSTGVIELGVWHHYAFVWDGATWKSYRDGAQYQSIDAKIASDPFRYVYLGVNRAGGANRDADVTWADFKIYMTALGVEDVEVESKARTLITDQGDIETHQFIEDKTQAQVTSRYCFEADEFYEELYGGYDVLEYIESTGTQYIDTGYVTTSADYTYELDMVPTKIGGFYSYMGFMASGTTPRAGIHEYSNVFMLGANATTNSSTTPVVNERVVLKGHFKSGAQKLYKNGTLIASNSTSFNHSSNTLSTHIFGRNYSSGRNLASIKLYSAKIYEGSTLVRHYIPVRRQSDSALGLYDILTNTFCANSGSGTFINGPAITNKSASIYEDMHVSGREIIEI